ncbi:hypothetical protein HMPREF9336_03086 [Segniliparus rugosus ATCC BAA-974]|uniref:DUF2599 domain-containing protein n=2 Tax=Segniliparus rugosus TaxID=286804 RepID=E5XUB4_SEGRC|nr:hypothetical protein HMPREF9336_03086 [Segniliparus rugosus ATCC BAA-974]
MRALAPALALGALLGWWPSALADPVFIDHVAWTNTPDGPSLHVFPTQAGRDAPADEQGEAWAEVLRLAPDADSPSMREQFDCHQSFAKAKESWNLEPWRPVVGVAALLASACNPGKKEGPQT